LFFKAKSLRDLTRGPNCIVIKIEERFVGNKRLNGVNPLIAANATQDFPEPRKKHDLELEELGGCFASLTDIMPDFILAFLDHLKREASCLAEIVHQCYSSGSFVYFC
jgi:hypothetical protein